MNDDMTYLFSFDSGTTATKTAIYNLEGVPLGTSTIEYELINPTPAKVEIETEKLWKALKRGTKDVLEESGVDPGEIPALAMSVQGETLIPIDKKGNPLRNGIVWLDNRAEEEAEILQEQFGEKVYKTTGQCKITPTWPISKIFWIKRNEPEIFEKVHKYLLVEDYMIYRLTGKLVSEGSLLCSTVYWDINSKTWWDEILDYVGISKDQLPEIREPGEEIASIKPEIASELGLSPETTVCTGALDQACGAVGVGNIKPGLFSENTGGALAICAPTEKPVFDPKQRMPCHYFAMPDTYMSHTFTTGGMVLKWFRDKFCKMEKQVEDEAGTSAYELIDQEAQSVPPGSEGLVMLPHLQGAQAPENNPKAKGVYFGFTLRHSKPHFARAVMEAIACILRRNIEVLEDMGIKPSEVRLLGGGSKSKIWNQIKADIIKRPTITMEAGEDAACLGAAILAGNATGIFDTVEEGCEMMTSMKEKFKPEKENFSVYDKLYRKYLSLYESLLELFD